jgi:hypothetical protein
MAEFKFLNTTRAVASDIIADAKTYITRVYSRAGTLFTTASPFSQLLEVMGEIGEMLLFYVEDATVEQNIYTAQQPESIYGLSRIAGHDPTRGFAAFGEITFRWAAGVDLSKVVGDAINIPANAEIKFDANGLTYMVRTNKDQFRIEKTNNGTFTASIIQGKIESQTVTGTGEKLQSFNIQPGGNTDHNLVSVSVNGELWTKFESLYDMLPSDKGYIIKTGIGGGLDIYFGNGNFGQIPVSGSSIEIEYIKHEGAKGNLDDSSELTLKWITEGSDALGNSYDLNKFLQVNVTSSPKMGGDRESTEFTKLIAPMASKSFVLATPDHYEYFLGRYGIFSYIDAYNTVDDEYLDDDNVIYIFAIPDVKKKLAKNMDYFSLPINEMFFDANEYTAMSNVLQESGQQMVTTEVKFVQPKARYYAMDISVRYFEGFRKEDIFNDIRDVVSNYLLNVTRRDKLPKSDIIYILEEVEGVDAVNVTFVSETEETARRLGYYESITTKVVPSQPIVLEDIGNGKQKFIFFKKIEEKTLVNIGPNDPIPADVAGLDEYGDIIMEKEEVAVFRGGWLDRDGETIKDIPSINEDAALTVTFDETPVPRTVYTRLQATDRKSIVRRSS